MSILEKPLVEPGNPEKPKLTREEIFALYEQSFLYFINEVVNLSDQVETFHDKKGQYIPIALLYPIYQKAFGEKNVLSANMIISKVGKLLNKHLNDDIIKLNEIQGRPVYINRSNINLLKEIYMPKNINHTIPLKSDLDINFSPLSSGETA